MFIPPKYKNNKLQFYINELKLNNAPYSKAEKGSTSPQIFLIFNIVLIENNI